MDRDSRVDARQKELPNFLRRSLRAQREHVGPRNHERTDLDVPEVERAIGDLAGARIESAARGRLVHELLQLFLR